MTNGLRANREHSGIVKSPGCKPFSRRLRLGDLLGIYELDQLTRSLRDLLRLLECLAERGINFRSLTESIDTSTPAGRMFCHVLGAFVEFERAMRCAAGFEAAKARGQIGRERSLPAKT